nr:hypothetical protein RTCK_01442 [Rhizobium sp. TCK]
MLIALMNGKSGRVKETIQSGSSWRDLFRTSEDLLTASVFGRLSYLDGPVLWSIICGACGRALPPFKTVELFNIEFWPTWPEKDEGRTVEPDVLLQFRTGDPSIRIDLIVEAKLGAGSGQYANQWEREWNAHHNLSSVSGEPVTPYLLAVGGLGHHASATAARIQREVKENGTQIEVISSSWANFLDAVLEQLERPCSSPQRRILKDIVEAFALAGYRRIHPLEGIISNRSFSGDSLNKLSRYDFRIR